MVYELISSVVSWRPALMADHVRPSEEQSVRTHRGGSTGGPTVPDVDPITLSGHKFIALAADSEHRARLAARAAAAGVRLARGVYEQPLHRQPILAAIAHPAGPAGPAGAAGRRGYPRADDFADRHLCLPLWRAIPDADVTRTLAALGVSDTASATRGA